MIQKAGPGDDRLLRHIDDAKTWLKETVPAVSDDLSGQNPHQGGFTGAIATDQSRAATRLERHVDAFEQLDGPIRQTNVAQSRDRWSTARANRRRG